MQRRSKIAGLIIPVLYTIVLFLLLGFPPNEKKLRQMESFPIPMKEEKTSTKRSIKILHEIRVQKDVSLGSYFDFLDSLVCQYDSLIPYPLDEHLLVRANDWIIDTLENTDYYRRMKKGQFVYDQRELIILKKGSVLQIPDVELAANILGKRAMVTLDLNIPEYKLRIIEADKINYTFPVRVGKNEVKYLKMANREVNLRTTPGIGEIVRIQRFPAFINPVNGHRYEQTKRDDGRFTKMPLIPYIEPEIDGHRYGQLIHPTTNPITLGKASSNGCIGLKEADVWRLYYYAPIGTKVVFRYDLDIQNEQGEWIRLEDIYKKRNDLASRILAYLRNE